MSILDAHIVIDMFYTTFHDECQKQLDAVLAKLTEKFDPNRFVNRSNPEQTFERFVEAPQKLFLLLGESGTGKSNLLCHFARKVSEEHPVLLLPGLWDWDPEIDFWLQVLGKIYDSSSDRFTSFQQWFSALTADLERHGKQLYLMLDGINETNQPAAVKSAIEGALAQSPTVFRFVISCRIDSFRLHFKAPFWNAFLFRGDISDTDLLSSISENEVDKRFRKSVSQGQLRKINVLIEKHRMKLREKRKELARAHAINCSVLLGRFNEAELRDALERYAIKARLTGKARKDCTDPLIFKFFAETEGRSDREVAEVFSLETSQKYLDLKITEVKNQFPYPDEKEVTELLFEVSRKNAALRSGQPGRYRDSDLFGDRQAAILENLVDSGILRWQENQDGRRQLVFSFDRMLSFMLSLQLARHGQTKVLEKSLYQLIGHSLIDEIDIHRVHYLLLFLDEMEATDQCQFWIQRFLRHDSLRRPTISQLPGFRSLPVEKVVLILENVLAEMARKRVFKRNDGDEYLFRNPHVDTIHLQIQANDQAGNEVIRTVAACATAFTTLVQSGHSESVLRALQKFLLPISNFKRARLLFPLITVVCALYDRYRSDCKSLLESLCLLEQEITNLRPNFYNTPYASETHYVEPYLKYDDIWTTESVFGGPAVLKEEISTNPESRIKLIEDLAGSQHPLLRAISIFSFPSLSLFAGEKTKTFINSKTADNNIRVRASAAAILPKLGMEFRALAENLTLKLVEDKDSNVRRALAQAVVQMVFVDQYELFPVLKSFISDESPNVRIALGQELIALLEEASALTTETRNLIREILRTLSQDPSNAVRANLLRAILEGNTDVRFQFELLQLALTGTNSRVFKQEIDRFVQSVLRTREGEGRLDLSDTGSAPLFVCEYFYDERDTSTNSTALALAVLFRNNGAQDLDQFINKFHQSSDLSIRLELLDEIRRNTGEDHGPDSLSNVSVSEDDHPEPGRLQWLSWVLKIANLKSTLHPDLFKWQNLRVLLFFATLASGIVYWGFDFSTWKLPWLDNQLLAMLLGITIATWTHFLSQLRAVYKETGLLARVFRHHWWGLSLPVTLGLVCGGVASIWGHADFSRLIGLVAFNGSYLLGYRYLGDDADGAIWTVCLGSTIGIIAGFMGALTSPFVFYLSAALFTTLALPIRYWKIPGLTDQLFFSVLVINATLFVSYRTYTWLELPNNRYLHEIDRFAAATGFHNAQFLFMLAAALVAFSLLMAEITDHEVERLLGQKYGEYSEVVLQLPLASMALLAISFVFNLHFATSFFLIILLYALVASAIFLLDDLLNFLKFLLAGVGFYTFIEIYLLNTASVWLAIYLSLLAGFLLWIFDPFSISKNWWRASNEIAKYNRLAPQPSTQRYLIRATFLVTFSVGAATLFLLETLETRQLIPGAGRETNLLWSIPIGVLFQNLLLLKNPENTSLGKIRFLRWVNAYVLIAIPIIFGLLPDVPENQSILVAALIFPLVLFLFSLRYIGSRLSFLMAIFALTAAFGLQVASVAINAPLLLLGLTFLLIYGLLQLVHWLNPKYFLFPTKSFTAS